MKNNESLQRDVLEAIKWEPSLNTAEIGVAVKDGVVTLSGTVDSLAKKTEAEDTATSVAGVKAVVENIKIKFDSSNNPDDNDIAAQALLSLKINWDIPEENIQIKVEKAWLTLSGELPWNYQKEVVTKLMIKIRGVIGVTNNIVIKTKTNNKIEIPEIQKALDRNWNNKKHKIQVSVQGTTVTLKGVVNSLYQRREAMRIVWNTPGVWNVDNQLVVDYS